MGFGGKEPITRRALLGGAAAGMIGLAMRAGAEARDHRQSLQHRLHSRGRSRLCRRVLLWASRT